MSDKIYFTLAVCRPEVNSQDEEGGINITVARGGGGKKSISPCKFPNMGRTLLLLLYPLDINFLQSGGVLHYQSHTRWWCDGSSVLQRIGLMSATTPFF